MSPRGEQVYRCGATGCKKERHSDVNHWVVLFCGDTDFTRDNTTFFAAYKWTRDMADRPNAEYACGYDHASILFARWMSTGSLQETREIKA